METCISFLRPHSTFCLRKGRYKSAIFLGEFRGMKTVVHAVSNEHQVLDVGVENVPALQQRANQATIKAVSSRKLFGGANEVIIQHQDESYVLRLTKQNKLILTK